VHDGDGTRRQGRAMLAACLHAVGWHRPDFLVEVNFGPPYEIENIRVFQILWAQPRKNPALPGL
jgi:hypothetical protein